MSILNGIVNNNLSINEIDDIFNEHLNKMFDILDTQI